MNKALSITPDARVVRVFISSTFRDMQAEREELIKRVFPQLRKLCDRRGVVWTEVDLRWGITVEEAERGAVLPICLAEIERCRPYFIGLLGERYGWVPEEINSELTEREGWLNEYRGHSVTELEMLHGVLNNPEMADHAFFYFRDPSYIETLSTESRRDFIESAAPKEIERYGEEEAARRAEQRRQKLKDLKERIERSNLPLRTNYPDAAALGPMVLEDLTSVINRLYPEGSAPNPLDREASEHEAFAKSRARVYIRRDADFERLNGHVVGDDPPLVLLGDSGVGKSALLANWTLEYRNQNPNTFLISHFIGASSESADWSSLSGRIIGELNRGFSIDREIPDDPEQLRRAVASALAEVGGQHRLVLVLDGLNQLLDKDGAPDLVWLPVELPVNVRLVLSTLPGRALDEIQKRGWPSIDVAPLRAPERKKLIADYLAQYTKKLSAEQVGKIAAARQAGSPLYVRALLEELRVFGEHETLTERIEHYLSAKSVPTLYKKILERYEQDYDRERPGLTRDAMSLIWSARRGLTESELMDLLGSGGEPLPRAYWSPLFLAAEQGFVNRGGMLGFSHDYLRQAVASHFLSRKEQRQKAHLQLADYFGGREINGRRIDEQPWQLAKGEAWKRLYYLLCDLPFFEAAWNRSRSEIKAFWTQVESHSDFRLSDGFDALLKKLESWRTPYVPAGWQPTLQMAQFNPEPLPDENKLWRVSQLLFERGHSKQAMRLRDWLKERFQTTGDRSSMAVAVGGQAEILKSRGDLDAAYDLYKQQQDLSSSSGNRETLVGALIGQAHILQSRGRLDEAEVLCIEAEKIAIEIGNRLALMAAIGNRAAILYVRGQTDESLDLYRQMERIARELEDREGLYVAVSNQALMLEQNRQPEQALALFKQGESIARDLGNRKGIAASLGYQARMLADRGDSGAAGSLLDEKEHICREMGDQEGLATLLQLRGEIARKEGDRSVAIDCYREEERIARQFDYQFALFNSLTSQARIHQEECRLDQALYLLREAEELSRESPIQLSSVLRQQSLALKEKRDFERALNKLEQAEAVCSQAGNQLELLMVLSNVAAIHMERNDFPRALDVLKREEPIAASLNDERNMKICSVGIPVCLGILGDHYAENGRVNEARLCYAELETRAREVGDRQSLQRSLEGQADLYTRAGNVPAALKKLEENEQLDRASGNRTVLANGLFKQATMLIDAGIELDKARVKAEEAEAIFDELNLTLQAAAAGALLMRIRAGFSGKAVRIVGIVFMLVLAGAGVALGMWKTWLWILGGPLVLFASMNLVLSLVPSLQRRYNDYIKRRMASRMPDR